MLDAGCRGVGVGSSPLFFMFHRRAVGRFMSRYCLQISFRPRFGFARAGHLLISSFLVSIAYLIFYLVTVGWLVI